MTVVRQDGAPVRGATKTGDKKAKRPGSKSGQRRSADKVKQDRTEQRSASPASSVAQVRLQADELAELRNAMRLLDLTTMSEALREGVRLLTREAREVAAAEEIRRFYGGEQAPLPDGVAPATDEELTAADAEQW